MRIHCYKWHLTVNRMKAVVVERWQHSGSDLTSVDVKWIQFMWIHCQQSEGGFCRKVARWVDQSNPIHFHTSNRRASLSKYWLPKTKLMRPAIFWTFLWSPVVGGSLRRKVALAADRLSCSPSLTALASASARHYHYFCLVWIFLGEEREFFCGQNCCAVIFCVY